MGSCASAEAPAPAPSEKSFKPSSPPSDSKANSSKPTSPPQPTPPVASKPPPVITIPSDSSPSPAPLQPAPSSPRGVDVKATEKVKEKFKELDQQIAQSPRGQKKEKEKEVDKPKVEKQKATKTAEQQTSSALPSSPPVVVSSDSLDLSPVVPIDAPLPSTSPRSPHPDSKSEPMDAVPIVDSPRAKSPKSHNMGALIVSNSQKDPSAANLPNRPTSDTPPKVESPQQSPRDGVEVKEKEKEKEVLIDASSPVATISPHTIVASPRKADAPSPPLIVPTTASTPTPQPASPRAAAATTIKEAPSSTPISTPTVVAPPLTIPPPTPSESLPPAASTPKASSTASTPATTPSSIIPSTGTPPHGPFTLPPLQGNPKMKTLAPLSTQSMKLPTLKVQPNVVVQPPMTPSKVTTKMEFPTTPSAASQQKEEKEKEREKEKDKDKESKTIAMMLATVPLLAKLTASDREKMAACMLEKKFGDAEQITKEGEHGVDFFIIKEGVCRVTKFDGAKKLQTELGLLHRNDHFGERALIDSSQRAETVASVGPVTCYVMDHDKFVGLFGPSKLNLTFGKRVAVSAETYDPKKEQKEMAANANQDRSKTADQRAMILAVVKSSILFDKMDAAQQERVVECMWIKHVPKGETIIKQGDLGDYWYVVEAGRFDIYVSRKGSEPVKVAARERGSAFGELALLYNAPRAATVTAASTSAVWVLDRWTFRKLLTTAADAKMSEYENFLRGVHSFETLMDYERAKIADALESVSFPAGHNITKQGDAGDSFFIIKAGEVVVTKIEPGDTESIEVARYHMGDTFGERALIANDVRAATCTALGPVTCLYLNREAFQLLMGPMEDIFKRRMQGYQTLTAQNSLMQASRRINSAQSMVEENFLNFNIKLTDLKVIGTLGKGSFGLVQLVKDPKTGLTYALKTVGKAQVVQLGQQEHIMSEKRVMASLNYPFLIKLHATFKDNRCLFFLLEPSLGGELFSLLRAKTYFDESTARFFAAGVVLAFEYMHSKGIIYRDLKPENLLLDNKGYIKVTDFGFAKKVGDGRTWTLCGTPDYLAPEVVSGQGHGKGVDWWTLGILIYEMLASYPPFYDEDPMKTYAKIMAGTIAFPLHFSKAAVDLIKRLLHPKATKRLGVVNGGARLIKDHPWFAGFDWASYETHSLPAPIVMPVKNSEDLSNFEEYPDENNTWPEYIPDEKNKDWDADF